MKKIYQVNTNRKKDGMVLLTSHNIDSGTNKKRDITNGKTVNSQINIKILNVHTPNMKQNQYKFKDE